MVGVDLPGFRSLINIASTIDSSKNPGPRYTAMIEVGADGAAAASSTGTLMLPEFPPRDGGCCASATCTTHARVSAQAVESLILPTHAFFVDLIFLF